MNKNRRDIPQNKFNLGMGLEQQLQEQYKIAVLSDTLFSEELKLSWAKHSFFFIILLRKTRELRKKIN